MGKENKLVIKKDIKFILMSFSFLVDFLMIIVYNKITLEECKAFEYEEANCIEFLLTKLK